MTRKAKVLTVEDNLINVKLLTVYLEEAGFEVVHAEDATIALDKIKEHHDIDVILLDRMMPNMDGIEALKLFQRWPLSAEIPVIMLTAAMSPAQISDALLVGAYACLSKPFDKEKIISTVKAALKDSGWNL